MTEMEEQEGNKSSAKVQVQVIRRTKRRRKAAAAVEASLVL
jgi:hypothetical protein